MKEYAVITAGNPILQQVAEPVATGEFGTNELVEFTLTLLSKMKELQGAGLAAPQLGVSKRIIALGVGEHSRRRPITIPDQIIINPSFQSTSDIMEEDYEGCFSISDGKLYAKVPRYKEIIYSGYDAQGNYFEGVATDLHARIIQHEMDHLDGILFLEKIIDSKSFITYDELQKIRMAKNEA